MQTRIVRRQYELQKMMYFDKIANYLASYLIIVREAINRFEDSAAILSIMLRPECPEAEGEFGLYLTYAEQTLGREAKNKLWRVFNEIHDFAVKKQKIPLELKNEAVKVVNDLINELPKKYAIMPSSLTPIACLKKLEKHGRII